MMFINNLRISKKLILSFTVLILAVVAVNVFVYTRLQTIELATVKQNHSAEVADLAASLEIFLLEQQNGVRGFAVEPSDTFLKRIDDARANTDQTIASLSDKVQLPEALAIIKKMAAEVTAYEADASQLIKELQDPATVEAARRSLAERGRLTAIRPLLAQFNEIEDRVGAERQLQKDEAFSVAYTTLLAGALIAAAISSLIALLLARTVAKPIQTMTDAMRSLAAGDKTITVPALHHKDEVGQMAQAVQVFKQAAIEKDRLEAEAERTRQAQEAERERLAGIERAKAEELQAFVHDIEGGFGRLADGDLTVRLDRPVAVEYETIRQQFNGSIGKLEDTVGSVVTSIGAIRTGLAEITV
ncbi:HAMP domain-containing protein, partial [Mangrovicella endophytica]|uniref:HAMP domain-containing protein n=1 Tax=Mangrovicella endophytica TaxID=2066697 RepID=UPI0013000D80